MMLSFRTELDGGTTLVAKRLLKGLALAARLDPVIGVLASIAKRLSRRFATDDAPDYVSPPSDAGRARIGLEIRPAVYRLEKLMQRRLREATPG